MQDPCAGCSPSKSETLQYTRCAKCGHWRKMTAEELAKVGKRKRG